MGVCIAGDYRFTIPHDYATTVSYTHLDVYKRQVVLCIYSASAEFLAAAEKLKKKYPNVIVCDIIADLPGMTKDVYKRQKVPTNHSQPTQNLFDDGEIETFLNNRLAEGTGVMMMKRYRKDSVQCARFRGKSTADNGVDPSAVAGSSAKYWVCSEYGQFYDQCAEYLSYLHRVLRQTCPTSP